MSIFMLNKKTTVEFDIQPQNSFFIQLTVLLTTSLWLMVL